MEISNDFKSIQTESKFVFGFLKLVTETGTLYFEDNSGTVYDYSKIMFLVSNWNESEGIKNFPGIRVYDEMKVINSGDQLIAIKVDSASKAIIILGSLSNLISPHSSKFLQSEPTMKDLTEFVFQRNNSNRLFVLRETSEGQFEMILNSVESTNDSVGMRINLKGKHPASGYFDLSANGDISVKKIDKSGKLISEIVAGRDYFSIGDCFGNQVLCNPEGLELRSKEHRISVREDGVTIKLKSDNLLKVSDAGVTVETNIFNIRTIPTENESEEKESLRKLLSDLTKTIGELTFTHPQGPTTGLEPASKTKLSAIIVRINDFMKTI
ncbi:MAG: hypothetical protein LCH52_08230 [Bacteroidetes bacterium]|nr:hypothetical protein [Bacteroidota bacterium]